MLQTIIMHGIAAALWAIALFMSGVTVLANKENMRDLSGKAFAKMLLLAIAAFTLQVLA
jgi:hypothetical protein